MELITGTDGKIGTPKIKYNDFILIRRVQKDCPP